MICLITYELRTPDMDYTLLYNYIEKDMGVSAIRVLKDAWWVNFDDQKNIVDLVSEVRKYMGEKDVLFITEIKDNGYNGWLPSSSWDWLRSQQDKEE